ncbi:MAG: SDR family NAD(P)-dependent oxidoreductase [Deltaproteobacteria bacterium]|nr:SDR family NAD(P)-dependent oxidoreductase [Deltaproteobacteria bacterium]
MTIQTLHGQVAIVTGAGSGIGRAVALALAQSGAKVTLAARTKQKLDELVSEITKAGGTALAVPTDVSSESQVEDLVAKTTASFGHIDILITSAGGAYFGPIIESRTEDWDSMINVNLRGIYLCCKHVVRAMLPRGQGHILNVLSIASTHTLSGSTGYTASKMGSLGLTRVIAAEVRSAGIKVTAVIPGAVDTPLWDTSGSTLDRSKMLSATDVANAMISVIAQPPGIHTDEIVLMPPLGVL